MNTEINTNTNCIFCKIIKREIPADIIFENDKFLVFKDIHPKASTHLLVIPKNHIASLDQIDDEDKDIKILMGEMMLLLPELARDAGLPGFRTVINTGKASGQEVFHLHCHLLGGQNLPGFK